MTHNYLASQICKRRLRCAKSSRIRSSFSGPQLRRRDQQSRNADLFPRSQVTEKQKRPIGLRPTPTSTLSLARERRTRQRQVRVDTLGSISRSTLAWGEWAWWKVKRPRCSNGG